VGDVHGVRENEPDAEMASPSKAAWVRESIPLRGASATHGALLLVQIAFASQSVEAKVAMMPIHAGGEGIRPEAIAMVRMLGGALFFRALSAFRRRPAPSIPWLDHARLAGLSILGVSLNQTLFLMGLKWSTPFSVSLLGATIPIFAAALAVLFRKEAFSWRTLLGLGLALSGVVSLVGYGALDRGAILVALNCLSYAAYVVFSREIVLRVGPLRTVGWLFTYAALMFAPLGLGPLVTQVPLLTIRGASLLAYIVAVPTIVAYLLNAWALGRSNATLVTVYIYLQPLVAALLAWAQLGQGISSRAWIAAVLILMGLTIVASRPKT
jgi:drug/metabolite transporter (DMT)-like permease